MLPLPSAAQAHSTPQEDVSEHTIGTDAAGTCSKAYLRCTSLFSASDSNLAARTPAARDEHERLRLDPHQVPEWYLARL